MKANDRLYTVQLILRQVFNLPNLSEAGFSSAGLSYLPSSFGPDFVVRRAAAKETLVEILVADIGDSASVSPYLVVSYNALLLVDLIANSIRHERPWMT